MKGNNFFAKKINFIVNLGSIYDFSVQDKEV